MKNLLIRLISFIICVGLFIAGLALTITETISNEAFLKDFEEIGNAKWLPEVEKTEEEPEEEPVEEPEEEPEEETGDESGEESGEESGGESSEETGNNGTENE